MTSKALLHNAIKDTDARLIVIDTLHKYLGVPDGDKNGLVTLICTWLEQLAREHHVTVLAITHTKKRVAEGAAAKSMMGATAWRGAGEVNIVLEQMADSRRTFQAEFREGEAIEPTYLEFDKVTCKLSLGSTVAAEQEGRTTRRTNNKMKKAHNDLLGMIAASPLGITQVKLLKDVTGVRDTTKLEILEQMVNDKEVTLRGTGKGDPVTYMFGATPAQDAENDAAVAVQA